MPRYIDAEAFKLKTQVEMTEEKSLKPTDANFHNFLDAVYSLIARGVDEMPTADVVERKKAFWEWVDDMDYRCSACQKYVYGCLGEVLSGHYKFCPYCGCAMEGEEDDGEEIH